MTSSHQHNREWLKSLLDEMERHFLIKHPDPDMTQPCEVKNDVESEIIHHLELETVKARIKELENFSMLGSNISLDTYKSIIESRLQALKASTGGSDGS